MSCWLWAIPPHNYPVCVEHGVFAIRMAGRAAVQRIQPQDRIFAYLTRRKVVAGVFLANSACYYSEERIWSDGVFPHRIRVVPESLLGPNAEVPLERFADALKVGKQYPNFGLVIQKVVNELPKEDCQVLTDLVTASQPAKDPVKGTRLVKQPQLKPRRPSPTEPVRRPDPVISDGKSLDSPAYLSLARSSEGLAFEEATRKCFEFLGFTLDGGFTGQSGKIDFVAVAPYRVFGECQTTVEGSVGVGIVDKLTRHRRAYQAEKKIKTSPTDISAVVCESPSGQLLADSVHQQVTVLRPSSIAALLDLRSSFPGAVHPYRIRSLISSPGDATDRLVGYLDAVQREIDRRIGIIEVLKNDRFVHSGNLEGRASGWIQARLETELDLQLSLPEIEALLTELESPLVGCAASTQQDGRRLYHYIQDWRSTQTAELADGGGHSRPSSANDTGAS